jgi:hypothetical protein
MSLVGGFNPLKNVSSSVGVMRFPTEWKFIKAMFQTPNQDMSNLVHDYPFPDLPRCLL